MFYLEQYFVSEEILKVRYIIFWLLQSKYCKFYIQKIKKIQNWYYSVKTVLFHIHQTYTFCCYKD